MFSILRLECESCSCVLLFFSAQDSSFRFPADSAGSSTRLTAALAARGVVTRNPSLALRMLQVSTHGMEHAHDVTAIVAGERASTPVDVLW